MLIFLADFVAVLDFEKYFFSIKKIKEKPDQDQSAKAFKYRIPVFSQGLVQSSKKKSSRVFEIDKPVDHVNSQAVHPYYYKEEGPFLELEDINHKVKYAQENERHSRGQQNERTRPHAFENRQMKTPNQSNHYTDHTSD